MRRRCSSTWLLLSYCCLKICFVVKKTIARKRPLLSTFKLKLKLRLMTRETCYFWSKIWFFFNFNFYCFASACGRSLLFRCFRTEHFFVFLICSSRNEKLPRRRKLSIDPQSTEYNCCGLFGIIKTNNWNEIFLYFFSFLRLVFHIIY